MRRKLDALCATPPGSLAGPLDITDAAAVAAGHARIVKTFGGVDLTLFVAGLYTPVRAWELTVDVARCPSRQSEGPVDAVAVILPELVARGPARRDRLERRGLSRAAQGARVRRDQGGADQSRRDAVPRPAAQGLAVYVINPGFVETPMTAQNDFRMPALIKADEAAREIVAGSSAASSRSTFRSASRASSKLLRHAALPPGYFAAVRRATGL